MLYRGCEGVKKERLGQRFCPNVSGVIFSCNRKNLNLTLFLIVSKKINTAINMLRTFT